MFKKLLLCVAVVVAVLPSQAFAAQNLSNILDLSSDNRFEDGEFPEAKRLNARVHNAILNVARENGFVVYEWTNNVESTLTEAWISYEICLNAEPDPQVVGVTFVAAAEVVNNYGVHQLMQRLSFIPCDTTITENELRDIFRKQLRQ